MGIDNFLTVTGSTHKRSSGSGAPATISSAVTHSPLDPTSTLPTDDYPISKLFLLREAFTKYTAFQNGDFLVVGSESFTIRAVLPWLQQGGLDTFYRLIVEKQL